MATKLGACEVEILKTMRELGATDESKRVSYAEIALRCAERMIRRLREKAGSKRPPKELAQFADKDFDFVAAVAALKQALENLGPPDEEHKEQWCSFMALFEVPGFPSDE